MKKYLDSLPKNLKELVFTSTLFPGIDLHSICKIIDIPKDNILDLIKEYTYIIQFDEGLEFSDEKVKKIIINELSEKSQIDVVVDFIVKAIKKVPELIVIFSNSDFVIHLFETKECFEFIVNLYSEAIDIRYIVENILKKFDSNEENKQLNELFKNFKYSRSEIPNFPFTLKRMIANGYFKELKIDLMRYSLDNMDSEFCEQLFKTFIDNDCKKDIYDILEKIMKTNYTELKWMAVYLLEQRRFSLKNISFLNNILKNEISFEIRWNIGEAVKKFAKCKSFPLFDTFKILISDVESEIRKIGFDILSEVKDIDKFINCLNIVSKFNEDEIQIKSLVILNKNFKKFASEKLFIYLNNFIKQSSTAVKNYIIEIANSYKEDFPKEFINLISVFISDEKTEIRIKTYDFLLKLADNYSDIILKNIKQFGRKENNFVVKKQLIDLLNIILSNNKIDNVDIQKIKEAIL